MRPACYGALVFLLEDTVNDKPGRQTTPEIAAIASKRMNDPDPEVRRMSASLLTQVEPETNKLAARARVLSRLTQRLAEMGIALTAETTNSLTYEGMGNGSSYTLQLVKQYPDSLNDEDVKREANELVGMVKAGVAGTTPSPPVPRQDIDDKNRKIDRSPQIERAKARRQRKRDREARVVPK
jgi:hypothetical protein